jgi:Tfp pilus assembly protein PilF
MSTVTQLIEHAQRLTRSGDLRQAEELFQRVLACESENTTATYALGRLCFRDGRTSEAVTYYRRHLDQGGPNADCLFHLGAALATLGEMAEAETAFAESIAQDASNAEAHFGLALCLEALDRKVDAERAYRAAIAQKPAFVDAMNNLGALLLSLDRALEALPLLDQVLSLKNDSLSARFNRGIGCFALGRYVEATAEFRAVLEAKPGQADALNELGRCMLKRSKPNDAAKIFREGARQYPADPRFLVNLSRACELCNDLAGAENALAQAYRIEPNSPALSLALASLEYRQGKLSQARLRLEGMLSGERLSEEQKSEVLLELALILDELGETGTAFANLVEGKRLRLRSQAVRVDDGDNFLAQVEASRVWFTKERVSRLSKTLSGKADFVPVFFVGFPRSGTTLIERAMKAHPQISTTDERSPLGAVLRDLTSSGDYPKCLERRSNDELAQLRQGFIEHAEAAFGPLAGRLLFDKMPMNIVHLGLINCLFPDARIVVALRDPRDVCLSCFMQRFSLSGATVNFLDLGKTVETYCAVMALWLQYRDVISLPWLELRYEDLVEDFDGQLRSLTEFIGLPWNADILSFRERIDQPATTTPSYRQVTRAIYKSSVGRWRHYEKELQTILPPLKPFVEALGYGGMTATDKA